MPEDKALFAFTNYCDRTKNNVFGKVCPFKADHDFILCTLGNKGELSQNLPINATGTIRM